MTELIRQSFEIADFIVMGIELSVKGGNLNEGHLLS